MKSQFRIGSGYDVHRLTEGRKLFLGGIEIPAEKGADGHSDADVLLHALCDAMLGAIGAGDIGKFFPDNDSKFKNYDSSLFLEQVYDMVVQRGYEIVNIDSTVILQKPKIAPYIPLMKEKIAAITGLAPEDVSVKATTSEKLGFVGKEEGIEAYATILLIRS
ncbi:MAG: 2-C-methyl-D-erythritol 2,4-cyclodiphosphate synthase [Ignavibacteriales bacterium]|nr:2-C-methyl-D-erythritol 2,4-cyclodiphosphate synthase [Ignavibacteriales bacterium]MCF8435940.1 2-C-methyl-D-erythritol 2,4-cyclodiphosphate synthase [Ignavibacteriales bacterium]